MQLDLAQINVGYRTDVTVGRLALNGMRLPYFEDPTAAARWAKYGHLAQFDGPNREQV